MRGDRASTRWRRSPRSPSLAFPSASELIHRWMWGGRASTRSRRSPRSPSPVLPSASELIHRLMWGGWASRRWHRWQQVPSRALPSASELIHRWMRGGAIGVSDVMVSSRQVNARGEIRLRRRADRKRRHRVHNGRCAPVYPCLFSEKLMYSARALPAERFGSSARSEDGPRRGLRLDTRGSARYAAP
jgi:hypothetical protein